MAVFSHSGGVSGSCSRDGGVKQYYIHINPCKDAVDAVSKLSHTMSKNWHCFSLFLAMSSIQHGGVAQSAEQGNYNLR